MPTASLTFPDGAKVVIEGSQAEVADLLARLQSSSASTQRKPVMSSTKAPVKREGPMRLIVGLIDAGFFKTPQELGAVRTTLEAQGHFYPATSLSPLMLRLVRGKHLRRIKNHKRWTYVQ